MINAFQFYPRSSGRGGITSGLASGLASAKSGPAGATIVTSIHIWHYPENPKIFRCNVEGRRFETPVCTKVQRSEVLLNEVEGAGGQGCTKNFGSQRNVLVSRAPRIQAVVDKWRL